MKILILNYEYPPIGGGCGVVSKYHAEGLAMLGNQVTVLTTWFNGEKEEEKIDNLTIIKLKSKRKYIHKSTFPEWISWIKKAKEFLNIHLQSQSYEYCFAHFALPGGEVARFIHRKFKIPYSIISHGQDIPWFFPKQMFKYHLITYLWIKKICIESEKLILLSQAMKKNADRFMGKYSAKNKIIPNGCDCIKFTYDYAKRAFPLKILFVGRLVEQKDPMTFLRAIKILKQKNSFPFIANVLGDGPLLQKMKTFCFQNHLDQIVEFKGWVDKEEVLLHYQSSDLKIISSKAEAMSIAALEAVSTGLYIISTPVSGNTDIIEAGINGDFINFGNEIELAERISDFYMHKYLLNYVVPEVFLNQFKLKYNWNFISKEIYKVCSQDF